VSECMDNCMFQIETALLRFDELSGADDDKTSVIKRHVSLRSPDARQLILRRLFYGKIRQRISSTDERPGARASMHEREDLFSHLPLNVSDEGYDLYDGLSGYFNDDVEFEGRKAHMEVSIVDLPPVLQIQLQVRRPRPLASTHTEHRCSACSSTGTRCRRTRARRTSSSARRSTWTASSTVRTRRRRRVRRCCRRRSHSAGSASTCSRAARCALRAPGARARR
jgi:hypothetical protein